MAIDWGIVGRAVHILAVVVWIGGVRLVTTVLLPGLKQKPPGDWAHEFAAIEDCFAPHRGPDAGAFPGPCHHADGTGNGQNPSRAFTYKDQSCIALFKSTHLSTTASLCA
jgi:hypothetical protein